MLLVTELPVSVAYTTTPLLVAGEVLNSKSIMKFSCSFFDQMFLSWSAVRSLSLQRQGVRRKVGVRKVLGKQVVPLLDESGWVLRGEIFGGTSLPSKSQGHRQEGCYDLND
jgi:hypothetical protein